MTHPIKLTITALSAVACLAAIAGCHQDPSVTAAPPAPSGAVAPPAVTQRFPHHRLPPLVVNGKPNGLNNAAPSK